MSRDILRGPGRDFSPNEETRRLNPQVFSSGTATTAGQGSVASPESIRQSIPEDKGATAAGKSFRIRQSSKPLLNKLEAEFQRYMEAELRTVFPAEQARLISQSLRFKLGNGVWYKPDFVFIRPAGTWTVFEVKGPHAFRGGFENLKVAAHQYPMIAWLLVWKDAGEWKQQKVKP